jgi:Gametolysin peptidase M11
VTARPLAPLALLAGLALAATPAAAATKPATYTGTFEVRHADDFRHDRSTTTYTLVRHRHRFRLLLTRAPRIPSGSSVVVEGRRTGWRLSGSVRPLHPLLRAATVAPGERRTAVILVKPDAGAPEPWTADYVRQRIFTDPDSTNAFYQEDSYGQVSLVGKLRTDGDVFGWYVVPATGTCDTGTIASAGRTAAAADGFVASNYQHIIYAFASQAACGNWAGLGSRPGKQSWMNGEIEPWVVAHELGHNMGLHHANSFACTDGGVPVAISANCSSDEYGDPYDVMGEDAWHNNAWHLRQIGFLQPGNVQTVTADGTYTVNSTATRGGIQLLRVRRPGSASDYYDISLRSASGVFDPFPSNDPFVRGVSIHLDPDPDQGADPTQSNLIDTTPGSPDGFYDAALTPGRTFRDGDVTLTTESVVAGVATVRVNLTPAPPADTTPPSAPGPVVAAAAGDRVTLSWPPSSDDVGVAGYEIFRDASLVQTTTETSWTDTAVAAGTSYTYRVEAYDAAGNSASSPVVAVNVPAPPPVVKPPATDPPATNTVTLPPADTSAPLVAIASPGRHAHLRRRATVRAAAADLGGTVAHTELWIDGRRRKRVTGGRLDWRWSLRHVRRGIHRVTVRAIDAAGNAGRASVRVRVVR